MENILVRQMNINDIDLVCDIEVKSFSTPWSKNAFVDEIESNKLSDYLVVEYQGKVVGYGGMWLILDEAHITNIAIHPNFRGKGLGNYIVEGIINRCREKNILKITLEVRESNHTAIALYKKYGFEECGKRLGYYSDTNEDAIIMWKNF
ncbi:ribosomal protein S18-alanine N-acetyltransferase [Abyssisolibacter fermentans]|uniref:ribosomal protein S18-alanine N-acetyltransferase n=1 Tax=Abyssisolibacter fermentans TaxID=1766203 RepID=UPI00082C5A6B